MPTDHNPLDIVILKRLQQIGGMDQNDCKITKIGL